MEFSDFAPNLFKLDEHQQVVPCDNVMEWANWFETSDRVVAQTKIRDGVRVSTVFLGTNHSVDPPAPPIVFETMIFGGAHDQHTQRYATWFDAEQGHEEACQLAR